MRTRTLVAVVAIALGSLTACSAGGPGAADPGNGGPGASEEPGGGAADWAYTIDEDTFSGEMLCAALPGVSAALGLGELEPTGAGLDNGFTTCNAFSSEQGLSINYPLGPTKTSWWREPPAAGSSGSGAEGDSLWSEVRWDLPVWAVSTEHVTSGTAKVHTEFITIFAAQGEFIVSFDASGPVDADTVKAVVTAMVDSLHLTA